MSENLENKYWVYELKKVKTAHVKNIKPTTKRSIIQYMAQAKKIKYLRKKLNSSLYHILQNYKVR